jgi:glycosyltransferase involved in cell wall biosynthesis
MQRYPSQKRVGEDSSGKPILSVGVLVDLEWSSSAGGHVKCWERFADAAAKFPDDLDLTLHFLGPEKKIVPLSQNVRYVILPPILGTRRIPFLKDKAFNTDLSPFNPRLLYWLKQYDVIHITDVFTFARTALYISKRKAIPLLMSFHTDLPECTRVYSADIIRKLIPIPILAGFLLDRCRLNERFARGMKNRVEIYLKYCTSVFVSDPENKNWARKWLPSSRIFNLRRGIDKEKFNPKHRDREKLGTLGIPAERFLLLFAGRVDQSKRVMTLGNAARILLDEGLPVHVVIVGEGSKKDDLASLLGANVTLTGTLSQATLSWLYPSCDLFAFPSRSEIYGNVLFEASASALPIMVDASEAGKPFVSKPGENCFLVEGQDPQTWALAIKDLLNDRKKLRRTGRNAAEWIHRDWPSWEDVLLQDLLPVWREAARGLK